MGNVSGSCFSVGEEGAAMCVVVFVQVYVHRKTREQTYVIPQVPLIMLFEAGSLTALNLTS